jgi:signal-transduction protein with cAMP-binding, CBS, and nucleotidyltransferase domain
LLGPRGVVASGDRPVGIITDWDIALALCERGFTVSEPVQRVMSCPVETLRAEGGLYQAARRMMELSVRRLPAVDGKGRLSGLASLDDLLLILSRTLNLMAEGIQTAESIQPAPAAEPAAPARNAVAAASGLRRRR